MPPSLRHAWRARNAQHVGAVKALMVEMQREMKSRWTIPYSELQLLGKIGMGDFGVVYLARWRNSKGAAPPTPYAPWPYHMNRTYARHTHTHTHTRHTAHGTHDTNAASEQWW